MPEALTTHLAAPSELSQLPETSELDCLRLQKLLLQQQVCRGQLNAAVMQFLHTSEPKAIQQRLRELGDRINVATETVFAKANLDPQAYQLNVETGTFTKRSVNTK